MNEQRIDVLERRIRRLTLAVVGLVGIGIGAMLMGATGTIQAEPRSCIPQPAGAPDGGFVVVPTADGGYAIIRPTSVGEFAAAAKWR